MSSPARPYSADGDDTLDLGRVRSERDDDRDEPPRSKRARTQERRAIQACIRCRQQKLRCPGGQPCARCVKADKECDFGRGNTGNIARPSNVTNGTALQREHERRATQACVRCRRQKLRCLGGRPCVRCVKASKECDFGRPGLAGTNTRAEVGEDGDGIAAEGRLEYLESRVANLLAASLGPDVLPAPPAASTPAIPALLSTSDPPPTQGLGQVRFGNSPEVNFISPYSYSTHTETISPDNDNEEEAAKRLASATRDGFKPPFQALVYQVTLSVPFSCSVSRWQPLTWPSHQSGRTVKHRSGTRLFLKNNQHILPACHHGAYEMNQ